MLFLGQFFCEQVTRAHQNLSDKGWRLSPGPCTQPEGVEQTGGEGECGGQSPVQTGHPIPEGEPHVQREPRWTELLSF